VTGLYAARVAARLRRELQTEVEMVSGRYGEFKILVEGKLVVDGGAAGFLGVLPRPTKVIAAVKNSMDVSLAK
jgi:hypothetical protein